jgi:hypothetical protein
MRQGDSDLIAFGQLGSTYTNTVGETVKPPSGRHIIAITFLEDLKLDVLKAAGTNHLDASFNNINEGAALADENGEAIASTTVFPKGLTIYGKWTEVSLHTAGATAGIICYFG